MTAGTPEFNARDHSSAFTIRDVARRAGVSKATVSNVLNAPEMVRPQTRERVMAAVEELGFIPNQQARQLSGVVSDVFGLIVLDSSNPYFTDIANSIEQTARRTGHAMILCNSAGSLAQEQTFLKMLARQRVRGIILTPAHADAVNAEWLAAVPIPVVLLDQFGPPESCSVSVDDIEGGRLAAAHLLADGHTSFAFVGGPSTVRQHQERYEGMASMLREHGLDPDQALQRIEAPGLDIASGLAAAEQLDSPGHPTAVFCANDLLAFGVFRRLARGPIRVPDDLALMGYDDIDFAADWVVPLTSMRQPTRELGRTAARLLLDHSSGSSGHVHEQLVFHPKLVVRESTAGYSRR